MTRNPRLSPAALAYTATDRPVPVAVTIATDDALMRASVVRVLADALDVVVVGEREAQVVLLDLGTDLERARLRLAEIRRRAVPVVAVIPDPALTTAALAAGARGVLQRDSIGPEWSAAVTAVDRGLTVLEPPLVANLIPVAAHAAPSRAGRPGTGQLTDRERQVVGLLAEGLSNKLIADRLGISDHTAKFHVNGVMAKLGAGTRTEAVVEAVRRGVVAL